MRGAAKKRKSIIILFEIFVLALYEKGCMFFKMSFFSFTGKTLFSHFAAKYNKILWCLNYIFFKIAFVLKISCCRKKKKIITKMCQLYF